MKQPRFTKVSRETWKKCDTRYQSDLSTPPNSRPRVRSHISLKAHSVQIPRTPVPDCLPHVQKSTITRRRRRSSRTPSGAKFIPSWAPPQNGACPSESGSRTIPERSIGTDRPDCWTPQKRAPAAMISVSQHPSSVSNAKPVLS